MKRYGAIGTALTAAVLVCAFMVYWRLQGPAEANPEYANWSPTPAAIQRKIGTAESPALGMKDSERRSSFRELFQQRYREHDPAVAIGLKFLSPTRVKLMCPARMEPFYMDRIALTAWHEAKDDFGGPIDIDIYETFIGTNQIKIGELRPVPGQPKIAHISYDYSNLLAMSRTLRSRHWPRPRRPIQMPNAPSGFFGISPVHPVQ